jgi:hypothetical protein
VFRMPGRPPEVPWERTRGRPAGLIGGTAVTPRSADADNIGGSRDGCGRVAFDSDCVRLIQINAGLARARKLHAFRGAEHV